MATAYSILNGLTGLIRPALAGLQVTGDQVDVKIHRGWPPLTAIQEIAGQPKAVIGVYERSSTMMVKYWPRRFATVIKATGIVSDVIPLFCPPGATSLLTLSYADGSTAVNIDDAVSLIVDGAAGRKGVVASAGVRETLTSLATKLVHAVNGSSSTVHTLISASAVQNEVTIRNLSDQTLRLTTATGNIATTHTEVARSIMEAQIVCYCGSWDVREAISDIIEVLLATFRADGFVSFDNKGNTEAFQVTSATRFEIPDDTDTPANVYRQDFFCGINYGINATEAAYSVLVPIANSRNFDE